MNQIKVDIEADKVIIDLCSRRTDMLISVDAALKLAEAIEERIPLAEKEAPSLFASKPWQMRVESFDGQVGFKFFPPEECAVTRVPLPVRYTAGKGNDGSLKIVNVAKVVADLIRFKADQAMYKMRMVLTPERGA